MPKIKQKNIQYFKASITYSCRQTRTILVIYQKTYIIQVPNRSKISLKCILITFNFLFFLNNQSFRKYLIIKFGYLSIMVLKLLLSCLLITAICSSPRYDENLAAKMVNVSAATYYTTAEGNSKLCPRCYSGLQVESIIQSKSLLSIVGYDPAINSVVVAFRGSDNNLNWVTDLRVRHSLYAGEGFACFGCLVHAGFRDSLVILNRKGLKSAIAASLQAHPNANIIFAGHSLGGALANLASIRFLQDNPKYQNKLTVYTLGQPRVGDVRYAKYHGQKIPNYFRLVHAKDLVPHQPPYLLGGTLYRHSGWEIWYQAEMKNKKICLGDSDDCSNSLGAQLSDYTFEDHSSNHYLKISPETGTSSEL